MMLLLARNLINHGGRAARLPRRAVARAALAFVAWATIAPAIAVANAGLLLPEYHNRAQLADERPGENFLFSSPQGAPRVHFDCGPCCRPPRTLFQWSHCCRNDDEEEDDDDEVPFAAERPDFTESSSCVGRGRLQIEMGYTYLYDSDGITSRREHSHPEALLRLGVFADWLELRAGWSMLDWNETALAGGVGSDDLYFGVKFWLVEQCNWLPEMAIIAQAMIPVGHRDITAGEFLPGLNWLYGWDISERWSCAGSTQVNRAVSEFDAIYWEFAQSFSVGYQLTEVVGFYTEWYVIVPDGADDGAARTENYINSGFTFLVRPNLQFDIRAGWGLNEAAADYFTGAGFAVRF